MITTRRLPSCLRTKVKRRCNSRPTRALRQVRRLILILGRREAKGGFRKRIAGQSSKASFPIAFANTFSNDAPRSTAPLEHQPFRRIAMRWVTLMTTENVEHTINMATIVQVVSQTGGARQVQLVNGEKFLIAATEWNTKLHEQIQRSRGVS